VLQPEEPLLPGLGAPDPRRRATLTGPTTDDTESTSAVATPTTASMAMRASLGPEPRGGAGPGSDGPAGPGRDDGSMTMAETEVAGLRCAVDGRARRRGATGDVARRSPTSAAADGFSDAATKPVLAH
jgi:hypothetical protein